jgi:FkbM family methyltransferase
MSQNCNSSTWLYSHGVLGWLYRPQLRHQLPLLYQFFAMYCWFQKPLRQSHILGGERLFQLLIHCSKALHLQNIARLNIESKTIFLNLLDPRMLQVPNELYPHYQDTAVLSHFLVEGDTFIDVGANHGSFSVVAAELVGKSGLVIAFEPQQTLADLVKNSLTTAAKCQSQVHAIACSDRAGFLKFYVPLTSSGSAGIFPAFSATATHDTFSVPAQPFDQVVDWQNLQGRIFIKLDVEGSELAFLKGAIAMLQAKHPAILLEVNPDSLAAAGSTGYALIQQLQHLGYTDFVELDSPTHRQNLDTINTTRQRNIVVLAPETPGS